MQVPTSVAILKRWRLAKVCEAFTCYNALEMRAGCGAQSCQVDGDTLVPRKTCTFSITQTGETRASCGERRANEPVQAILHASAEEHAITATHLLHHAPGESNLQTSVGQLFSLPFILRRKVFALPVRLCSIYARTR